MKTKKPNTVFRAKFTVPHYKSEVWIVVAHDARIALNRMRTKFGEEEPELKDFGAMCIDDEENKIGVFFYAHAVTNEFVSHEIDHVVNAILKHVGASPKDGCDSCEEHRALLSGVINEKVRRLLAAYKIKVKL